MKKVRCPGLMVAVTLLTATPLYAQGFGNRAGDSVIGVPEGAAAPPAPPAWGTSSETVIVIPASNMVPPNQTIGYTVENINTAIGTYQTTTVSTDWWLGFQIPAGAQLTRVVVEGCDTSNTGQLSFGITRATAPGGLPSNIAPIVATGSAATPGCAFFTVTPTNPTFVTNQTQNFWFFNQWTGAGAFSGSVRLLSIRVYYRLQVSPAPATATFADMPVGNPYHRFVEALVAAGITSGCMPNLYCPDAPVTRAQMAVFLSAALGLHWPN